ncbi:MAG: family 78 glycoside hydrolase catalytic domain [Cyclobacteriaceae bacterium]|nr:family 78 glycoside hydrolase catalytic domain [Cyclobacteriaceae bacterium]
MKNLIIEIKSRFSVKNKSMPGFWSMLLIVFFFSACTGDSNLQVVKLTADYLTEPLGLEKAPQLSWQLQGLQKNIQQSAYQILAASHPDKLDDQAADLWNTGKVNSNQSVLIPYKGKTLNSGDRVWWQVRVWDQDDNVSAYSQATWWEMTLLKPTDWKAEWISHVPPSDSVPPVLPSPYFRKEFSIDGKIKNARLYISGLGYYEALVNGQKVGDHVLDPMLTRYDQRVKYVAFDVTSQLREGSNAMGVVLGNGWYNQHTRTAWDFDRAPWRESPSLMAQLVIHTEDGNQQIIATDQSWKFSEGPIVFNGIHNGETYDARLELGAWSEPGYSDEPWKNALKIPGPSGKLSAQIMPPIRVTGHFEPAKTWQVNDSVMMYDLSQNITGWANIKVKGPAGSRVTIRYGERIFEDGTLDLKELSRFIWTGDTQTDRYILKGAGEESWHSVFVYHGFQYMELTKSSPDIEILHIQGDVVHSDLERRGDFRSSNEMFNQIQKNIGWSFLGNYHGYPTDCPHREKMGWTGDAMLVAEVGLFNFDIVQAYLKWLDDFVDEQQESGDLPGIIPTSGWGYNLGRNPEIRKYGYGPQWEGAFMEIPWQMYRYTGDLTILERYYPYFKKYIDFLESISANNLLNIGIDDHKQLVNLTMGPYLSSAHYYYFSNMLANMASLLGNKEDAVLYTELAQAIKNAFNQTYYDKEKGMYDHGVQTPMALALHFDLVEDDQKEKVVNGLLKAIEDKGGHIDAGVVGTKAVLNVLMKYGKSEVLYALADKRDFPGWGYWIDVLGANTMYQNWDGSQSLNHIMFGSIADYFFKGLAGIEADDENPGFGRFIIRPDFENEIDWVEGWYDSQYGKIASNWKKDGNKVQLEVEIPANTRASIWLKSKGDAKILVDGKAQNTSTQTIPSGVYEVFELGSGKYTIKIQ